MQPPAAPQPRITRSTGNNRRHARARLSVALCAVLGAIGCASDPPAPMDTVSDFEPELYIGDWSQIATIPAWFQRDCVANTKASYALTGERQVRVVNTCDTADGGSDRAEGRARFTGPANEGRLEVTFARAFGIWLWPASGEYWVLRIGPDYQWSVVGHPSRDYAWVLARSPTIEDDTLATVAQVLEDAGYDLCTLELTTPERSGRLCDAL